MSKEHSNKHIIQSLAVNLAIAVAKLIAAVISGSGAMLAETLHSFADCGNQCLLLFGVHRARRPATIEHPLGHGAELYFWSFMVALLLFTGGGMFSIYEGIHKLGSPEAVGDLRLSFAILLFSLAMEGWSTYGNIVELNARRGRTGFFRYLQRTKDSDLIVIFGENSAAVVGLIFALIFLSLAAYTGDGRYDAVGSIAIGAVLVGVAMFLATEIKSLLVGERADPELETTVRNAAAEDPRIISLHRLLTVQRGPGETLVAFKIQVQDELRAPEICVLINDLEKRIRDKRPDARWLFVEPDMP